MESALTITLSQIQEYWGRLVTETSRMHRIDDRRDCPQEGRDMEKKKKQPTRSERCPPHKINPASTQGPHPHAHRPPSPTSQWAVLPTCKMGGKRKPKTTPGCNGFLRQCTPHSKHGHRPPHRHFKNACITEWLHDRWPFSRVTPHQQRTTACFSDWGNRVQ